MKAQLDFDINSTLPKLKLSLKIESLVLAVARIKNNLNIDASEVDPNVIRLNFSHYTPQIAKNVLDSLMNEYQAFLKQELNEKIAAQVDHLTTRQNELFSQYFSAMKEHVGHFEKSIQSHGVMTTQDWQAQKGGLEKSLEQQLKQVQESIELYSRLNLNILSPLYGKIKELEKEKNSLSYQLTSSSQQSTTFDLRSGKNLLATNASQINENQLLLKKYSYVSNHVLDKNFEISSLSSYFDDSTIKEMIQKGGLISNKEEFRKELKTQIDHQIAFLSSKRSDLENIRESLSSGYNSALQKEIALLRGQNRDETEEKLRELKKERQFLTAQIETIALQRSKLPEQWMSESLLKIKADLNSSTLEALSQLVESTTIKQNLKHIDARPMEWGFSNMKRFTFSPFTRSFLFSLSVTFIFVLILLAIQLVKGLPISIATLKGLTHVCFPRFTTSVALSMERVEKLLYSNPIQLIFLSY